MNKRFTKKTMTLFESIKHIDENGVEYTEYRHFLPVIEKAKIACENSGQRIENHFEDILEMVEIGSGAERALDSIKLSRYACYLIVQNADPSKTIVAQGLYGGMTAKDIHARKGLKLSQKILDHMGST